MNLDDIFDVGKQHESHEGGLWVRSDTCVTCNLPIPDGSSWCVWHHPGADTPDISAEDLQRALAQLEQAGLDRLCGCCRLPLESQAAVGVGTCLTCLRLIATEYRRLLDG